MLFRSQQKFLNPIPVGQMPHQMAMSTDGNTLYVGNTGGESIAIVDLNAQQVTGGVIFPPVPRSGTSNGIYPRSLAMGLFGLEFIMSNGTQWQVVGNTALPRPADAVAPVTLSTCPACGMIATADNNYILTLSGNGTAYVYDSMADSYVASRLLIPAPITGYYGVLAAGLGANYFLVNGLILNTSLTTLGGSAAPGATTATPGTGGAPPTATIVNTGNRNVAAVAPLNDHAFLWLTTPVRQNITTATRDDSRTTLQTIDLNSGSVSLVGPVPENPVVSVFGTTRFNTNPRMMVVDSAGATAYAITISGLSVISLAQAGANTQPVIAGASSVVNASGASAAITPGSFITIGGKNLASSAVASTLPPPTVLGGSCVTFGDIALPLLSTSSGQIQAQVPATMLPGTQVVEVRSLATAQDSAPVVITVKAAGN